MNKYAKLGVLFALGGCTYVGLEKLWRGRSHGSMFLAGGTCFVLIGQLNHAHPRLPVPLRALVGALIVTMVEFAAGLLVNRDFGVWDYRDQPGNLMGQICPLFSALWIPLSLLAIYLYSAMEARMEEKLSPV